MGKVQRLSSPQVIGGDSGGLTIEIIVMKI